MLTKYTQAADQIKVILNTIGQDDQVRVKFMPGDKGTEDEFFGDEDQYFIEIGMDSTNMETVYKV